MAIRYLNDYKIRAEAAGRLANDPQEDIYKSRIDTSYNIRSVDVYKNTEILYNSDAYIRIKIRGSERRSRVLFPNLFILLLIEILLI